MFAIVAASEVSTEVKRLVEVAFVIVPLVAVMPTTERTLAQRELRTLRLVIVEVEMVVVPRVVVAAESVPLVEMFPAHVMVALPPNQLPPETVRFEAERAVAEVVARVVVPETVALTVAKLLVVALVMVALVVDTPEMLSVWIFAVPIVVEATVPVAIAKVWAERSETEVVARDDVPCTASVPVASVDPVRVVLASVAELVATRVPKVAL
jgi:hypothetical protein